MSFGDDCRSIFSGNFLGAELTKLFRYDVLTYSIEETIATCKSTIKDILALDVKKNVSSMPFVLIIDEASLLTGSMTTGTSLFRLFRRAVHALAIDGGFVVITLGTNSDVVDLNPGPTFASERESRDAKLFPVFILNRVWDIFLDRKEYIKKPIGYYSLRCGKMLFYLFSLGRPVWASIDIWHLVFFGSRKIANGSLKSGEAYLAFWMIRTGMMTNPTHTINAYLMSSLMATLLFVSPKLDYMRVYYPSEPALAIAVAETLGDNFEAYYEHLERFIERRAIDQGRFAEIISMDITLHAIHKAKAVSCDWNYENKNDLPAVCSTREFILEDRVKRPKGKESENVPNSNAQKNQIETNPDGSA